MVNLDNAEVTPLGAFLSYPLPSPDSTAASNVGGRESGRARRLRRAGRQPNGRPLLRGAAARRSNEQFRRRLLREQERGGRRRGDVGREAGRRRRR